MLSNLNTHIHSVLSSWGASCVASSLRNLCVLFSVPFQSSDCYTGDITSLLVTVSRAVLTNWSD